MSEARPLTDVAHTLETVTPPQARLLQAFLKQPRRCKSYAAQQTANWRFCRARQITSEWVELESAERRILVAVSSRADAPVGVRPWWQYQGESRLLAWLLEHDTLLLHLNDLFKADWQPRALYQWHGTQAHQLALDWQMSHAKGTWTGSLVQFQAHAVQWLTETAWQQPTDRPHRLCLTAQLSMLLPAMTESELMAFELGDVLLAGSQPGCWRALQLRVRQQAPNTPHRGWQCRLVPQQTATDRPQLCIDHFLSEHTLPTLFPYRGSHMTTDSNATTAPPDAPDTQRPEAANAAILAQLPLTVSIELAELQLPVQTLMHMQPGYLLDLPHSLANARVTVKVQQQPWASGELVMIGDNLGIRILENTTHGSEQP